MTDNTVKLLRCLTIDRSDDDPKPSGLRPWVACVLGTAFVTVIVSFVRLFAPIAEVSGRPDPIPVTAATLPAQPSTDPEPNFARSLVASGYVVARRKATVAAEI